MWKILVILALLIIFGLIYLKYNGLEVVERISNRNLDKLERQLAEIDNIDDLMAMKKKLEQDMTASDNPFLRNMQENQLTLIEAKILELKRNEQ